MWASLATSLMGLLGEMVYLVDTGIQVWNSIEVNEMINDPKSGFGQENGLVFENAGTANGTSVTQRFSNNTLPQPISDTTVPLVEEGPSMYDCTLHTACLNGGTCWNNECICSHGFSGKYCANATDHDCEENPCPNGGTCWNNECIIIYDTPPEDFNYNEEDWIDEGLEEDMERKKRQVGIMTNTTSLLKKIGVRNIIWTKEAVTSLALVQLQPSVWQSLVSL